MKGCLRNGLNLNSSGKISLFAICNCVIKANEWLSHPSLVPDSHWGWKRKNTKVVFSIKKKCKFWTSLYQVVRVLEPYPVYFWIFFTLEKKKGGTCNYWFDSNLKHPEDNTQRCKNKSINPHEIIMSSWPFDIYILSLGLLVFTLNMIYNTCLPIYSLVCVSKIGKKTGAGINKNCCILKIILNRCEGDA